jgi:hypothetical protein
MTIALLFLRRWGPSLLGGLVVLLLAGGGLRWLSHHDARIRLEQQLAARDTVIRWRTDTAAVKSQERRVDSVTVTRILVKVRHDTAWRRDTVRLAGDTTSRVAIPLGVLEQHDSAFAACDRLNRSCAAEHAADSLVIRDLRQSLALARTGYALPPPLRRWSIGVTGGYGAVLEPSTGRIVRGPGATLGGSFRLF